MKRFSLIIFLLIFSLTNFLLADTISKKVFGKNEFNKELEFEFVPEFKTLVQKYEKNLNTKIHKIEVMSKKNNENMYIVVFIENGYIIRGLNTNSFKEDVKLDRFFKQLDFEKETIIDYKNQYKELVDVYEKNLDTSINKIELLTNKISFENYLIIYIGNGCIVRKLGVSSWDTVAMKNSIVNIFDPSYSFMKNISANITGMAV